MKENTDHMDTAIKDKFEGHEVPVPAHLWASIESNLPSEEKKTSGNFPFKNPFILSIIAISTVIIGIYTYNSNKKHNDTAEVQLRNSNISNDVLHSSTSLNSNTAVNASTSSLEKEHVNSTNSPAVSLEDKTPLLHTSSNATLHTKTDSNKQQNKRKHTTDAENNTNASLSTVRKNASTKSGYSAAAVNNNQSLFNKNSNVSNSTKHITDTRNNTHTVDFSIASKQLVSSKETHIDNTDLNVSGTNKRTQSDAMHTAQSTRSNTIQSSNDVASKNMSSVSALRADSIKQTAAVFMQQFDLADKNNNRDTQELLHSSTSKEVVSKDKQQLVQAYKDSALNTAYISRATLLLNETNHLSNVSETVSLFGQSIHTNPANVEYTSADTKSDSSTSLHRQSSSENNLSTHVTDATENRNSIDHYFNKNTSLGSDSILAFTETHSNQEVLLKIDSVMNVDHIDTASAKQTSDVIAATSTNENEKKKSLFLSRCSLDGYATPSLGHMYLSPNNNQEYTSHSAQEHNKNTNAGFGITTGLRMNYALTQKIEVGVGFQYSSLNQQSSLTQQHLDSSYMTYQGYTKTDSIYNQQTQKYTYFSTYVKTDSTTHDIYSTLVKTYVNSFQNFSIPIHVAYGYSISNKVSLIARTSLLINYQKYSVTYFNSSDSAIIGYHSNKNISLGASFSVGCYYQFSKRYAAFIEPTVSYFSNVFDKQAPFKQKQLMMGLQAGIRLSF